MVSSCDEAKLELVPVTKGKPGKEESIQFVEQFVRDVVDFSSQYGSNVSISYTAYNITGNPSKFPDYGDFPQTFVMRTYGRWWDEAPSKSLDYMPQNNGAVVSHDYIVLEYEKEVYPIRISIYETYNPGSVVAIWAKDESSQWLKLWSGPPQIVPHKSRIFSPPLQLYLDAVLLIGTSELLIPNAGFHIQSLSSLLRELGEIGSNNEDCHNLTPDYLKVNQDLRKLKSTIHKHCILYKSKYLEKVPKGRLAAKLGLHCHYIPPIEEAFNSLQKFLQEDFPKLIRDINLSSSMALTESEKCINSVANNTCGSFSALPDETVLKIFKKLDLKSLNRCSQVNRHFNNIAHDALLYTSLNLKPYWYCVDTTVLNSFITKCQYLQKLDLSWCGINDLIHSEDFIAFLKSSGSTVTHLRLNCCRFVNNFVVQEISQTCRNLKELCLRNCTAISDSGFAPLQNLEHLERLEFYRTLIETDTLCKILRKNSHLRHINLASMHDKLNMDEVAAELSVSCIKLESIDFWKAQTLTVQGIRALAFCTNLKEIDLGWCTGIGTIGDSLRVLFSSCKNLEKVFMTAFRGLSDRDLEPLLLCKKLQQLDLLGARFISVLFCQRLLCNLQLRMIDLSFCEGVSNEKILEMRRLYPHVSIKRVSQING